jgi:hypothetical protein
MERLRIQGEAGKKDIIGFRDRSSQIVPYDQTNYQIVVI